MTRKKYEVACSYIASVANLKIGDDHFAFSGALREEAMDFYGAQRIFFLSTSLPSSSRVPNFMHLAWQC